MPAKGQSQSEETKKKISEVLKKNGQEVQPTEAVKRSPEAQALFDDFSKSMDQTTKLQSQKDTLLAKRKSLGRKKATAGARKKIKEQLVAVAKQMKEEKKKRQALRQQAHAAKRVKMAKSYIEKAKGRENRFNAIEQRTRQNLAKAKTPESRDRYQNTLKRIGEMRVSQKEHIDKANRIISEKGIQAKRAYSAFNFSECEFLEDRAYSLPRHLTEQEQRTDFKFLNDQFNKIQTEMEAEILEASEAEIDRYAESAKQKLDAGDIAAILALGVWIKSKVKDILDRSLTKSFDFGKTAASKELKVSRPATSLLNTQLKNLEVGDISEGFVNELQKTGRGIIKNALAADASSAATASAVKEKMKESAETMTNNISGTLVGQYLNRGRRQVFLDNINRISAFQRSEVLDLRTCNMCASLDKRVVKADDPMAEMDVVHSHCRGVWIPIFVTEDQPKVTGIPQSIAKNFDLIDGRPTVNAFKQLKKSKPAK